MKHFNFFSSNVATYCILTCNDDLRSLKFATIELLSDILKTRYTLI